LFGLGASIYAMIQVLKKKKKNRKPFHAKKR
jgi:hypothetical protein